VLVVIAGLLEARVDSSKSEIVEHEVTTVLVGVDHDLSDVDRVVEGNSIQNTLISSVNVL
jgi:hypothetical protein